jgi:hypothetical protein
MGTQPNHLPRRLPAGTKYVIEGRGGRDGRLRVFSRYVEFPDGQHLQLQGTKGRSNSRRAAGRTVKKNLRQAGTPLSLGS